VSAQLVRIVLKSLNYVRKKAKAVIYKGEEYMKELHQKRIDFMNTVNHIKNDDSVNSSPKASEFPHQTRAESSLTDIICIHYMKR
jgi:hypothetical protein